MRHKAWIKREEHSRETEQQRREQTKIGQVRSMNNKSKIILKRKTVEDVQENKKVEPKK